MSVMAVLRRVALPLASRKVRVALATVLSTILAEWKFEASEGTVFTIVSVGVALILGIAHEDAGAKGAVQVTELKGEVLSTGAEGPVYSPAPRVDAARPVPTPPPPSGG